jgi:hypothetical protein
MKKIVQNSSVPNKWVIEWPLLPGESFAAILGSFDSYEAAEKFLT